MSTPSTQTQSGQPAQQQTGFAASEFSVAGTVTCRAKPKRTAFVGDSIMSGFKGYGFLHKGERNFAAISRRISTVTSQDLPEIIAYKPDRVYIMVGTNDCVGGVSKERGRTLAGSYKKMITKLHKSNKNMEIIVMGVGPVRGKGTVSNKSVRTYNAALKKMVAKLSWAHYMDPGDTLRKNGELKKSYDGGDGAHWAPVAYRKVRQQMNKFVKEW